MENINLFEVLDKEEIKKIEKSLAICLIRLGVNVEVSLSESKTYDGRPLVKVKTTEFQSIPVIYKSIRIEGYGILKKDEKGDNVFRLRLPLSYYFNYFGGGSNGVDLGVCSFTIFSKYNHVICEGLELRDF